jgi:hypothetical protein
MSFHFLPHDGNAFLSQLYSLEKMRGCSNICKFCFQFCWPLRVSLFLRLVCARASCRLKIVFHRCFNFSFEFSFSFWFVILTFPNFPSLVVLKIWSNLQRWWFVFWCFQVTKGGFMVPYFVESATLVEFADHTRQNNIFSSNHVVFERKRAFGKIRSGHFYSSLWLVHVSPSGLKGLSKARGPNWGEWEDLFKIIFVFLWFSYVDWFSPADSLMFHFE